MNQIIKNLIVLAIIFLTCAFIQNNINPFQWHWVTKLVFAPIVALVLFNKIHAIMK